MAALVQRSLNFVSQYCYESYTFAKREIDPKDVPEVRAALLHLGHVVESDHGTLSLVDAKALTTVPLNFYEWALGVTAIAVHGTPDDADDLVRMYAREIQNVRQAVWIDYCFAHMLPEENKPSVSVRHELLLQFLRRREIGRQIRNWTDE